MKFRREIFVQRHFLIVRIIVQDISYDRNSHFKKEDVDHTRWVSCIEMALMDVFTVAENNFIITILFL